MASIKISGEGGLMIINRNLKHADLVKDNYYLLPDYKITYLIQYKGENLFIIITELDNKHTCLKGTYITLPENRIKELLPYEFGEAILDLLEEV